MALLLLHIHTSPTTYSYLDQKTNLSKIAPTNTTPEEKNLPLNIPRKGIVDQAYLIKYAQCDENLKCAGFLTLLCPFV